MAEERKRNRNVSSSAEKEAEKGFSDTAIKWIKEKASDLGGWVAGKIGGWFS